MSGNEGNGKGWPGNHWRIVGWGTAAIMLFLPLIAMQFTDEVNWDVSDFIIFGAMLVTETMCQAPASHRIAKTIDTTPAPLFI